MVGSYRVKVSQGRRVSFEFEVRRNITLVGGDSGTGKTTLYNMIVDYMREGNQSGVSLQCERPCVALADHDWQYQLSKTSNSIVFIDEGRKFVESEDFARAVRGSSNYYVLFTRTDLPNLPFSIKEIYKIKTSGKHHTFEPLYPQRRGCRFSFSPSDPMHDFDILIVEDSKSGYQFFETRFSDSDLVCETGKNNSGLLKWLDANADKRVFAIADGAAFGAYAQKALRLQDEHRSSMAICLPESFEWLLMASGVVRNDVIKKALEDPSSFVDSSEHESWEQFFCSLLKRETAGTSFAYQNNKLANVYVNAENADKVMALIACRNIN